MMSQQSKNEQAPDWEAECQQAAGGEAPYDDAVPRVLHWQHGEAGLRGHRVYRKHTVIRLPVVSRRTMTPSRVYCIDGMPRRPYSSTSRPPASRWWRLWKCKGQQLSSCSGVAIGMCTAETSECQPDALAASQRRQQCWFMCHSRECMPGKSAITGGGCSSALA